MCAPPDPVWTAPPEAWARARTRMVAARAAARRAYAMIAIAILVLGVVALVRLSA